MRCPLCNGPLRLDGADQFACERGHELPAEELARTATSRVTMAFWMAIEALESEAEALQVLSERFGGSAELALRAAEDAKTLRELAMAHLPDEDRVDAH